MQTLVKCPNCGTVNVKHPFYEPDNDANTLCLECGEKFKWEDYE